MNLEENDLIILPPTLGFLQSVETLNLGSNKFSSENMIVDPNSIFKSILEIPRLRKLNLSRNKFKGVHLEGVDPIHFSKLVELDFGFN